MKAARPAGGTSAGNPAGKPLRGEAAWLAAKAEIARRNDAARDRAAVKGAAVEARRVEARLAAERREAADLPEQPHPDPVRSGARPSTATGRARRIT
jgi:hypothetical protein